MGRDPDTGSRPPARRRELLAGALLPAHRYLRRGELSGERWSRSVAKDRGWERFYRNRWSHTKVVRSTHGVNCTGSCSWRVHVKDGLITWETQQVDYPSNGPQLPDYEPRGCPRGASFAWYECSPLRVRYPYVRGALLGRWRRALTAIVQALPAASGAMVMATGIVSIGLFLDGQEALSLALLGVDASAWAALALVLGGRMLRDFDRVRAEARSPAALTGVAATAVFGTRLALQGWSAAGAGALALALLLWLALVPSVLAHWRLPTIGINFVLTVATQSLAVLSATLAVGERASWLLYAALPFFLLGLAFYVFVLARFDMRQLLVGAGDHWITGGALAISTLAAGRITLGIDKLQLLGGIHTAAQDISLALWALTMLWLPALLAAELVNVRLSYSVRRWSTLFPVGMYAACSFIAGDVTGVGALGDFARVWVWSGVALWVVIAVGMLHRAGQIARGR